MNSSPYGGSVTTGIHRGIRQRAQDVEAVARVDGDGRVGVVLELLLGPQVERHAEPHGGVADRVADALLRALAVADADAGDAADGEPDPQVAGRSSAGSRRRPTANGSQDHSGSTARRRSVVAACPT
jgi:hypothetical protein